MKIFKVIAAALAIAVAAPAIQAQTSSAVSNIVTALTQANGNSAGSALLSLYTQYKATGKLDLKNPTNISSLITLAQNIKGLKEQKNTGSFLKGLISGSKNLVNNSNSSTALSALGNLSSLDLSSLGKTAATSAATSLLSKAASKTTTAANDATSQASSILTGLFSKLTTK